MGNSSKFLERIIFGLYLKDVLELTLVLFFM